MNLERFVTEKHGVLGKKMHLGRSRNDLIATTLKIYTHDELMATRERVLKMISALVSQAQKNIDVIVPGMTHLQNGQPVRLAQVFLSHAWALKRDVADLEQTAKSCLDEMPLGSAALSGTSLSINLQDIAKELGFKTTAHNSYDQVGNRDSILKALSALAMTATHLSRLAEDTIFWSSAPVGLMKLPAAWSTGSSIMPNKRNPDVAELARAKSAHVIGALATGLTMVKALPTSYASDLHEIKKVFMGALDELNASLEAFAPFTEGLVVNTERATALLNQGHILATEIADDLALNQGVPFREAYQKVAALVEMAESKKVQIHQLNEALTTNLSFEAAVEKRSNSGGTSRSEIQKQIYGLTSQI